MDNSFEFISFLNSLKTGKNDKLLESIENGFLIMYEEEIPQTQEQIPTSPFNISDLKSIKSFAGRVKYIGSKLKKLGSGSSRSAYLIDDNTVLKLATNKKGIAQNDVESDVSNHYDIVPEVIDADWDNYIWLIVKRAKKLTSPKRFEELTKISWTEFVKCLIYELDGRRSNREKMMVKPEILPQLWEHEFFSSVTDMAVNFGMPSGDLTRLGSYGEISGKAVVIDSGLTQDVYNEFYK